jgi:hypothetical protein
VSRATGAPLATVGRLRSEQRSRYVETVATKMDAEIRLFNPGDEIEYEALVNRRGGWVLTERPENRERYMIHDATCSHLQSSGKREYRFSGPRRWSQSFRALRDWARGQTGHAPLDCQTCR